MPYWCPAKIYKDDTDAFVIGGGPSLKGFEWALLEGKNTIGCNAAATVLGPKICKVCFFSDKAWFDLFRGELMEYAENGGKVFTHNAALYNLHIPWLNLMRRERFGLYTHALGFGGNSGCSAVNLALIFGATRVYLLGFDCRIPVEKNVTHWHDRRNAIPREQVYQKFMEGWGGVAVSRKIFPNSQIINLGPDSAIPYFPQQDYKEVLCPSELQQRR